MWFYSPQASYICKTLVSTLNRYTHTTIDITCGTVVIRSVSSFVFISTKAEQVRSSSTGLQILQFFNCHCQKYLNSGLGGISTLWWVS